MHGFGDQRHRSVPLIFNFPERVPAVTSNYLAQGIDIAPTALRLGGVDVPIAFQGIDLFAENRPPEKQRLVLLTCSTGGNRSDAIVSDSGWKMIYDHRERRGVLYFRSTGLDSDNDLAKEYPGVARVLQQHLLNWRKFQILYHRESRYHELFYAPRTPELNPTEISVLIDAAKREAMKK